MALLPDELRGEGLVLRRWALADVPGVLAAVTESYDALHQWMDWAREPVSEAAIVATFERGRGAFDDDLSWQYLVFDSDEQIFLGGAGLRRCSEPGLLEIGYWTRTTRTGQGVATRAVSLLTEAGFLFVKEVDTILIRMDTANLASASVPAKLDFHLDREESRPIETPGHTGVGYVWSVARIDWRARRP